MYVCVLLLIYLAISPADGAVVKSSVCSEDKVLCNGDQCIDRDLVCDGNRDCPDGSDEDECPTGRSSQSLADRVLTPDVLCSFFFGWKCADGSCIAKDKKCDGTEDCADKSDEAESLCKDVKCEPNWFRAGLTDGKPPCLSINDPDDGFANIKNIFDKSLTESKDTSKSKIPECVLPPYPDNGKYVVSNSPTATPGQRLESVQLTVLCDQGYDIPMNGVIECNEGRWSRAIPDCFRFCMLEKTENVEFYCPDGEPAIELRICDTHVASGLTVKPKCTNFDAITLPDMVCTNGSWNYEAYCSPGLKQPSASLLKPVPTFQAPEQDENKIGYCELKKVPNIRYYCRDPDGREGQRDCNAIEPAGTVVRPECENSKYGATLPYMTCMDGGWDYEPVCNLGLTERGVDVTKIGFCKLENNPSVHYYCFVFGDIEGQRACNTYEPSGTIVRPECNSPNYDSTVALPNMRCIGGSWNYIAVCNPECGRVTPDGTGLIIDGWRAQRGELPWHVGIYRKTTSSYEQICGGSLITNSVVLSAAHCFWSDSTKLQPASRYAVASGKLYRDWDYEENAQKSEINEIRVPPRFRGSEANFQEDIAVVILKEPFEYRTYVRPVCLNFNINFDRRQLRPGKLGKVAGWGLTAANGGSSSVLKVVDLPYVDIEQCISNAPRDFRENITGDKICAGYMNGTALCRGDSGGGLAFPESERGTDRYYLRGIVSTAPRNEHACNAHALTAFTHISRHEHFVTKYL